MRLRLLLLGDLGMRAGKRDLILNLEGDAPVTLKELLLNLSKSLGLEEAQDIDSSCMVMVNGSLIPFNEWDSLKLKDDDLIVIAPLYIGGG